MLHYISVIALAIALSLTQSLSAQNSISGNIKSSTDGPLPGANVVIKNTTAGTASDAEGNFEIKGLKNGEYTVRASFFGYGTAERKVSLSGGSTVVNFELVETAIDLDAVVVTGTRTEKSLANTPILTQTINFRELQKKDVTDITQALEFVVPGMEFASTATGKSLSLQGIQPQYMVFLVDGERLAGETFGDVDYSRINMADIERIEVVKGASSTLYGSNALGGVVNIITKRPEKGLDVAISSRFSKFNTQNQQLSIGSKLGKFSTQTSVVFDKTDGYDLQEENSYRTQEKEDALVISEHLKYSVTKQLELEGTLSLMDKNRDNSAVNLLDRKNRSLTYGAKGTYFFNPKSNIVLSWNSDNYEILDKVGDGELNSVYDNLNNTARLLGSFHLAEWNLLTVGTEYNDENLTASRNKIVGQTNTDFIMFAQEDIQLGENIDIIGGVRAHNNSEYGWHVTPQVSAMFKIWHFSIRGNYSLGYKTPTLKEKYMDFKLPIPGPPMFLIGNEDLKPETSRYGSLSLEYTCLGVSFSVSVYRNHILDMISEDMDKYSVKPGGIIEYTYRNYEEVLLKGIDILLRSKIVKNLYFNGAVTFSEKYDQLVGKEFANVRNFTGKFSLNYNLTSGIYQLNTNLQSNFYGAQTINLMDDTTHEESELELDSFSLWKLTTTHTFKTKYHLKLGVDNVFDFLDSSGGYNSGTPGRVFFVGLGLNI